MRRLAGGLAGALVAALPAVVLALTATPNDTLFGEQWALHGVAASTKAPNAWCVATGAGALVADIDSGADFNHPDLAGRLIAGAAFLGSTNGQPTGTGQAAVQDDFGHGTLTTGVMVADANNGTGIAGEAPGARALIVKVLDQNGNGNENDIYYGVVWAVDHGAQVINLSIGPDVPLQPTAFQLTGGDPFLQAIDYAAQHGRLVVLAAGNSSLPAVDYTSIQKEALVVGALGPQGEVAFYSNNLAGVNVYAPGGDDQSAYAGTSSPSAKLEVVSTYIPQNGKENAYALAQGTSLASPYAAGVAALLVSTGRYSPLQARARILATATTANGVPQVDAQAALGACPASTASGSSTASSGGAGTGARAAAAAPPAGTLPSAVPPTPPATPDAGNAGAASSARPPNAVVARFEQIQRIPTPIAAGLVILGVACIAGAAIWFSRSRIFTQP